MTAGSRRQQNIKGLHDGAAELDTAPLVSPSGVYKLDPGQMQADWEWNPNTDPRYASVPKDLLPNTECLADVVVRMLPYWYVPQEAVPPLGVASQPRCSQQAPLPLVWASCLQVRRHHPGPPGWQDCSHCKRDSPSLPHRALIVWFFVLAGCLRSCATPWPPNATRLRQHDITRRERRVPMVFFVLLSSAHGRLSRDRLPTATASGRSSSTCRRSQTTRSPAWRFPRVCQSSLT